MVMAVARSRFLFRTAVREGGNPGVLAPACEMDSRLRGNDDKSTAFILSPVAVDTAHQGNGVGQRLIAFGIQRLKEQGVDLVFTYGDSRFYSKVGFQPVSETCVKAPLKLSRPDAWLAQSLTGDSISPIKGV